MKFVLAKSFARIHRSNLINSGILPLVFENPADYDTFELGDELVIENAPQQVTQDTIEVKNLTKDLVYKTKPNFSDLETDHDLKGRQDQTRSRTTNFESAKDGSRESLCFVLYHTYGRTTMTYTEHFQKIVEDQLARVEKLKNSSPVPDFAAKEKIIIGTIDGDGIGR